MARHLRKAAELGFEAITIEGALIAPEQVAAIAATGRNARTASAYGVLKGLSLGEEIARYFRIGQAIWRDYSRIDAPTVAQTAAFVRDLLSQTFGFDDLTGPHEHREGTRRYRIAWEAKQGRVPIVVTAPAVDDKGRDVGFTRALPEFGDGAEGRARRSAVVLLQDWLNANADFYWGLVFAGDRVRLMRDNASLTRAAWIEADLGTMFRDEMFADFTAWWLLTHASRFGVAGAPPSAAALEEAREAGLKQGVEARAELRRGVETALTELGQGLVNANPEIRQQLTRDVAATGRLFEELLRTVYRLIFLAVAEDRDLLHPRTTGQAARTLYAENYSFAHARQRSRRRVARDAHHDAWEGMKVTFKSLEHGQPLLGLPALGGLFAREATPMLNEARISNRNFLAAIHSLGFIEQKSVTHRINWRDMKTEELGSVYESLLEIRPRLSASGEFELDSGAKGNARKTSGSYYTPDSLVETLLDSALDPVLDRAEAEGGVDAILDLKVIDPACGSGHFLLGAARRMADKVAELRDPDAPDRQAALRDVVARCIHGVDRNPMAVELAKVALWIESVSPGQPLGFLEANIRCGDALLGVFDLEALEQGVPDDAYKPLTGDSKDAAAFYKKKNRDEKKGQGSFDFDSGTGAMPPKKLAANLATIRRMPEDTVGQVEKKREAFEAWRRDPARWNTRVACDLYTAAFLLPKTEVLDNYQRSAVPTTADVWKKLGGGSLYGPLEAAALDAAEAARAFHWPLAFPDVLIGKDGFNVVLGNPPWERIKLQEQEFFAGHPVADEPNAAARTRAIARLAEAEEGSPDRQLYESFQFAKRIAEAASAFARVPGDDGGRYRYTGTGDVNTYALFAEHFLNLLETTGCAGIILPLGIATNETLSSFFSHVISAQKLVSLYSMAEIKAWFAGTKDNQSFCLVTFGSSRHTEFVFRIDEISELEDKRRRFILTPEQLSTINPNTRTAPIFRAAADAELTARIYSRAPILWEEAQGESGNHWGIKFLRMFDMSGDSDLFKDTAALESSGGQREGASWINGDEKYVPLFESKMVNSFDHRWGYYPDSATDDTRALPRPLLEQKRDPSYEVSPRYWVNFEEVEAKNSDASWRRDWFLGWRDITNVTNERTLIPAAVPRFGFGDKFLIMRPSEPPSRVCGLYANLASLTADFVARQKLGGTSLKYHFIKQFPILPPSAYTEADLAFIVPRVLELTYTSHSMAPLARDLGYEGPPFAWDEDRRAELRAELDAWYALAYGLTRDELRYVLDPKDVMGEDYPSETFRVLKTNEERKYGEYRTRRLVLAAYDSLVAAAPDTSAAEDGAWAYNVRDEADVRLLLAAIVKRMRQPRPIGDVMLAFLYAAQPQLLTPLLSADRQAEWRRLVGDAATTAANVVSFASAHLSKFMAAKGNLAANGAWRFDQATGKVDRGSAIYASPLPPSTEGRADFVWHAMRSIALDSATSSLSQEEQTFLARAAAA